MTSVADSHAADADAIVERSVRSRWIVWALLAAIVMTIYVVSPVRSPWGDSTMTIPTASSLLRTQSVSLEIFEGSPLLSHYAVWILDDRPVNSFPWTVSIFAIPVVVVNDVLARFTSLDSTYDLVLAADVWNLEKVAASLVAAVVIVLMAELTYQRLAGRRVGRPVLWSAGLAATFALGTSLWSVASRALYQHGPAMLLALGALLIATHVARRPDRWGARTLPFAAIGAISGFAYTVRPTSGVLSLLLAVWVASWGWRRLAEYVVGAVVVLAAWVGVNLANGFGITPEYSGSGRIGVHDALGEALVGNLVSPARGLLVFSPFVVMILAFALAPRHLRGLRDGDRLDLVALVAIGGLWVGVSMFPHWWGGHSFGPRLMADTLPFLVLASVPLLLALDRAVDGLRSTSRTASIALLSATALCVGWSVVAHGQGALLAEPACWNRAPDDVDEVPRRVWSVRDAQVTSGLRSVFGETPRTLDDSRCFIV